MQIDNGNDIDVVMPIYNLIEYSYSYCETLWQYYRDEPSLNNAGVVIIFLVIVLRLNLNKK